MNQQCPLGLNCVDLYICVQNAIISWAMHGALPWNVGTDSQELALNAAVHKILFTVFTTNQLILIIIRQL